MGSTNSNRYFTYSKSLDCASPVCERHTPAEPAALRSALHTKLNVFLEYISVLRATSQIHILTLSISSSLNE